MTRLHRSRRGLSLLEVVVSMAILLFSIVGLTHLINMGTDRALDVQQQSTGTMLAQRKLAEVMVGATPMGSTGFTSFEDEGMDEWQWKLDATQNSVNGLWNVQVTVKLETSGGRPGMEIEIGQMVLDPTLRGSSLDPQPAESMYLGNGANTPSSSSSASGSTTPSNGMSGGAAGGAMPNKTGGGATGGGAKTGGGGAGAGGGRGGGGGGAGGAGGAGAGGGRGGGGGAGGAAGGGGGAGGGGAGGGAAGGGKGG
jgi:type II secretion system protein I